jgi:hypothetical protein
LHKTLSIDFWQNWRELLKAELENQAKARAVALLQCKNAILTDKEFRYCSSDEIIDKAWLLSDMAMAIVQDNGSLSIIFNDKTRMDLT